MSSSTAPTTNAATESSIIGPRNGEREQQDPDILRPPSTDRGNMPNLKFSFADAHMKIRDGGWSREVTQLELPVSTTMAGVSMRLKPGGVHGRLSFGLRPQPHAVEALERS